jgi:CHAT domain-containing protein
VLLQVQALLQNTLNGSQTAVSEGELRDLAASDQQRLCDYAISIGILQQAAPNKIYDQIWLTRGAVSNVLAKRELAISQQVDLAGLARSRRTLRSQVVALVLDPADRSPEERASRHVELERKTNLRDELDLEALFAVSERSAPSSAPAPTMTDLLKKIPPTTVVVDFVRYNRMTQDPKMPGKQGEQSTPSYLAFVCDHGQVRLANLGKAEPIEKAIEAWRAAIEAGKSTNAHTDVRKLAWEPVERLLPAKTERIYLSLDGTLQRVPWIALPSRQNGKVLLEEYQIVGIPSMSLIAETPVASTGNSNRTGRLFVAGDIDYDTRPADIETSAAQREGGQRKIRWTPLTGTKAETQTAVSIFGKNEQVASAFGAQASVARAMRELPQARWAIVATHGMYSPARSNLVDEEAIAPRIGSSGRAENLVDRYPLLFSQLVFAGANLPRRLDTAGFPLGDDGLLSADAVSSLDLRKMDLAVLSACETAAGEHSAGENLAGLQRAFHLAGAKAVVGSLWKVDDAATVALMELMYKGLWRDGLSPEKALRNAQLAILRQPVLVAQLARQRGLDAPANLQPAAQRGNSAQTRLWAGFTVSQNHL